MKVVVTGATGFIGRAVLEALSRRGIIAVGCARSNLAAISALGHKAVLLDLHEAPADGFDRLGCPDVLIHLAWGGLPNYRSLHHFESELPTHYRFLRGLIEAGLPTLVVAGTCFEYGMQSGPLREDMPTRPENPYGFAKDTLRRQLEFLRAEYPFALIWARLFYLYGEGQAETSLLPQLRKAVFRGDRTFNMSGGEQLRDYLPVSEAADLFVSLAIKSKDVGVVNVCAGAPVSVRRLVENWISQNGWFITPNLGHYPYPDYEPMAFWGERSKLDALLNQK